MWTADALTLRGETIRGASDLTALLTRLSQRGAPLLEHLPPLPEDKALLSVDGGRCPEDGATVEFDPWEANAHRCSTCGAVVQGDRHRLHWTRFQHLWLAERMAHLATIGVMGRDHKAIVRAQELMRWYGERYDRFPNRDNILGPSRLFFSTYLESIWVSNVMAAAFLLREAGVLDDTTERLVAQLADAAASIIGEYNEGFSNRQTWNNAALAAIAVWFEDAALAESSVEGPAGLLTHLLQGFGSDGMWYEGENYHLFALRGLLTGLGWSRLAGVDVVQEPVLLERLGEALMAPARTALPDGTFPARKDARYGVSLAQPMYLELWELGLAWMVAAESDRAPAIASWLSSLYRLSAQAAEPFESYLHDAGLPPPPSDRPRTRADLSWWMALEMLPTLPPAEPWEPETVFLVQQGLAVLRHGARYASLECGRYGGGHGHPDRLHLTLHADGVHWLPDMGTGSYVAETLPWYRSTLAHNAPLLDGQSQPPGNAVSEAFDEIDGWSWVRGRYGAMVRTVVAGPAYLLDVTEFADAEPHTLDLPWHLAGTVTMRTPGTWKPLEDSGPWVEHADICRLDPPGPVVLDARHAGSRLVLSLHGAQDVVRGLAPGLPPEGEPTAFHVARAHGSAIRMVTLIEPVADGPGKGIAGGGGGGDVSEPATMVVRGDSIEITRHGAIDRHRMTDTGWTVEHDGEESVLGGLRAQEPEPEPQPILDLRQTTRIEAIAPFVDDAPALDGSLDGFDCANPLELDHDDQYRRSEEPYPGPEALSATAYLNWNHEALYLAVEVRKSQVYFRPRDAAPLLLDNEVDDIHSDGIQVYLRPAASGGEGGRGRGQGRGPDEILGALAVPDVGVSDGGSEQGTVRVRFIGREGPAEHPSAAGSWTRTGTGYRLTLALTPGWWDSMLGGDRVHFDLIVNEMREGRVRRAGQLVWSGGGGWVWLRGDRQDPARFGTVELCL